MKRNAIYIDLNNKEQVSWFNKVASKLIKVVQYDTIVETTTDKKVGYIICFKSLFSKYVINKNTRFLNNPVTAVISTDES